MFMKTISGKPVSEEQIDAWVTEAEDGYNVEPLRRRGRKPRNKDAAKAFSIRLSQRGIRPQQVCGCKRMVTVSGNPRSDKECHLEMDVRWIATQYGINPDDTVTAATSGCVFTTPTRRETPLKGTAPRVRRLKEASRSSYSYGVTAPKRSFTP